MENCCYRHCSHVISDRNTLEHLLSIQISRNNEMLNLFHHSALPFRYQCGDRSEKERLSGLDDYHLGQAALHHSTTQYQQESTKRKGIGVGGGMIDHESKKAMIVTSQNAQQRSFVGVDFLLLSPPPTRSMLLKLSNREKSLIFSVLREMIISSIIWIPMPDIRYIEK